MKQWIDLHMHSKQSLDGEFTVKELVMQAKEANISVMAIADHNCVRANYEAKKLCEESSIMYLSAVEIDCIHDGVNFHILGYGINPYDQVFLRLEDEVMKQEVYTSQEKIQKIKDMGFYLNHEKLDELMVRGAVTGEMIAEAVIYEPENQENPLVLPYINNGSRSDNPFVNFYWDYFSQGKTAYVPIQYISLEEAVHLITKSGGKAVLAHPAQNIKGDRKLFDSVLDVGVSGVEVYSSYHNKETMEQYYNWSKQRGAFLTCGSDYHGKTKPSIQLLSFETNGQFEDEIKNTLEILTNK